MKVRFKDQQKKQRHKRREYQKEWRDEELAKLKEDEKVRKQDKDSKRKENRLMREEEMFREILQYNEIQYLPKEDEIAIRKQIRLDVKQLIKAEQAELYDVNTSDEEYYQEEDNMERRVEDKVMFGSDSDQDIIEYVVNKLDPEDMMMEYYNEYGEEEGYEEGEYEQESDALEFERQPESAVMRNKVSDELRTNDNELVNTSVEEIKSDSESSSQMNETPRQGEFIEMVDLSLKDETKTKQPKGEFVMKEF
jgi:hypothetical protein